ncbi:MAG: ATP-binding protein [Thermodesulfovibrionia bacterium]|nr:ATP-binding protein [Thermodesulfovibrionia bacterium]
MTHLSDDTFESFLTLISNQTQLDLRDISFIDPYGMVGILEIGRFFYSKGNNKSLIVPYSEDVLKYLERMDFFKYAEKYFKLEPDAPKFINQYSRKSFSDVLLEITSIEKSDDIHFIVGKVKKRAHAILETHLHYNERAINGFIVALSEACQNIIEHSENTGFVGIQKYHFQNINKNVVKIAVMDLGIGFKKSLEGLHTIKDDIEALEKALLHGASRYADRGRGHGLAAVRRFVNEWNGKLSIRSGTAKFSILPDWGYGKEREKNLTFFPGAQINIMLPEV